MFSPSSQVKVYVRKEPTDMRCSYSGLIGLTRNILNQNPLSGHLFVFVSRNREYLKALWWDGSGYCIWSKRLERGTFRVESWTESGEITIGELKLMLEGYERKELRKRLRFSLPATAKNLLLCGEECYK